MAHAPANKPESKGSNPFLDTGGYQTPPNLPKEFAPKFKTGTPSIYELELAEILNEMDTVWAMRRTLPAHLANAKIDFERIICLRRYKICA